jgi:hypothetical protein
MRRAIEDPVAGGPSVALDERRQERLVWVNDDGLAAVIQKPEDRVVGRP